jgi:hypothetical protein
MTFIKDLIEIPDHVEKGSFVLRLAEGVTRPEETLREYVVTPELKACFDDALSFIKGALQTRTSRANCLHSGFGSGKSHSPSTKTGSREGLHARYYERRD